MNWDKLIRLAKFILIGITALLLIALPLYGSQYTITTFVRIIYFGFLAVSVGFLLGQGGMLSLTQAAFFGMTGYTIALLGHERGIPFPWPDLIGIGIVLVAAALVGLVSLRTYGLTFLMITLAFGQICWAFANQNTTLLHGWSGFRGIRPFVLFGIDFRNSANFYWMSLALFAISLYILWRLVHSPFGLALNGVRENPRRMAALGYPVYWIRFVAFLIAALYAGIGGILAVYYSGLIAPPTIHLSRAIWALLVVILGGSSYFWGPVVGTFAAIWLEVLLSRYTQRYLLFVGLIFVIVVLFSPQGILGIIDSIRRKQGVWLIERIKARIALASPGGEKPRGSGKEVIGGPGR
ncbi:MAG: branched-chain amino acid ABC transporter permease [Anaerolineae bacterium]